MFRWGKSEGSGDGGGGGGSASEAEATAEDSGQQPTRAELLRKIQSVMEKNQLLEMRFRDVVKAYRSTLKEKEALEASLASLAASAGNSSSSSSNNNSGGGSDSAAGSPRSAGSRVRAGHDAESGHAPDTPQTDAAAAASDAETAGETGDEGGSSSERDGGGSGSGSSSSTVAKLQEQVRVLSKSLATLTSEKSKMLARFQADKKTVNDEHRAAMAALRTQLEAKVAAADTRAANAAAERDGFAQSLENVTQQLVTAREEGSGQGAQWEEEKRALQARHQEALVAQQRRMEQREQQHEQQRQRTAELEKKLQAARDAELEALTQLSTGTADLKTRVASLEEELAQTQAQLMAASQRSEGEELLRLKTELRAAIKKIDAYRASAEAARADKDAAVQAARQRVEDIEARMTATLRQQEEHANLDSRERMLLEARLTELSALVGRYESSRIDDSKRIAELREQMAELMEENRRLAAAPVQPIEGDEGGEDSAAALQEKVVKLKSLLWISNQRLAEAKAAATVPSGPQADGSEIDLPPPSWHEEDGAPPDSDVDEPEIQEARQMAESYYSKARAALEARNEAHRQRAVAVRLKSELEEKLRLQRQQAEAALTQACDRWESENDELRAALRGLEDRLKKEHQEQLGELQMRNKRTRERTMALLADRDEEIARLRKIAGLAVEAGAGSGRAGTADSLSEGASPAPSPALEAAFGPPPPLVARQGSLARQASGGLDGLEQVHLTGASMHLASVEAEQHGHMLALKKRLRDTEGTVQQLNERLAEAADEGARLRDEVGRLQRNARREGANLEYLKNVVLRYIDGSVPRERTLQAIATILQFSRKEREQAFAAHAKESSSWWPLSPAK